MIAATERPHLHHPLVNPPCRGRQVGEGPRQAFVLMHTDGFGIGGRTFKPSAGR